MHTILYLPTPRPLLVKYHGHFFMSVYVQPPSFFSVVAWFFIDEYMITHFTNCLLWPSRLFTVLCICKHFYNWTFFYKYLYILVQLFKLEKFPVMKLLSKNTRIKMNIAWIPMKMLYHTPPTLGQYWNLSIFFIFANLMQEKCSRSFYFSHLQTLKLLPLHSLHSLTPDCRLIPGDYNMVPR